MLMLLLLLCVFAYKLEILTNRSIIETIANNY